MLPYSSETLFSLFGYYNRAVWPAAILAALLGAGVIVRCFSRPRGGGRVPAAVVALAWFWVGLVFHRQYFAPLNFAAPIYSTLFLLQGALVTWFGVIQDRMSPASRRGLAWRVGVTMMIAALVLYPLADAWRGPGWPAVRLFGLAPAPTVLFTFGWLLIGPLRPPRALLVIPLLLALVEAYHAFVLRIPYDVVILLAAGATWLLGRGRRVA